MGIKDKFSKIEKSTKSISKDAKKEMKDEIEEDKKRLLKHSKRIKRLWKSSETVQLKTETIAVLWRKRGNEEEFFEAFDKITNEGYELKLSEDVKAVDVGPINFKIGTYYYFQHRKFIK